MTNLKPLEALTVLHHLGALDWRKLTPNDHAAFCDAGPDARIAEVSYSRSARIVELLTGGTVAPGLDGLLAVCGGDETAIELHGVDANGEPLAFGLPLNFIAY